MMVDGFYITMGWGNYPVETLWAIIFVLLIIALIFSDNLCTIFS